MFKFARYFFLGFLITTVMPLLLMFFLTHHQMESVMHKKSQTFTNISVKQLASTTDQYLKIQEGTILEKMYGLPSSEIYLSRLQNVFKPDKVEFVYDKNVTKVASYYEVIKDNLNKPTLYCVSILPVRNLNVKGIKIIKKVDIKQLRPMGPFNLEIYFGDKVGENVYKETVIDSFIPKDMKPPFPSKIFSPPKFVDKQNNLDFKKSAFSLTNNDGKTVATLVIFPAMPPFPARPPNPIDNLFGIIILVAGITLSILMGIYTNRNFVEPLIAISSASKKIKDGDLSPELFTKSKQTHILELYHNFNEMIQGLRDRKKIRKSFISSLTHDLRTPLIAQEKSLGLIANKFEQLNMQSESELAKSLERNNQHLLKMVNLIVESYSFDEESLNLKPTSINLVKLIDDCQNKLKPFILEKNIEFINEIPKDFPSIIGDLTSFKRIFLNILSNSIEYIPKNSFVKISADISQNFVNIYFEDNGDGISQEDLQLIFDRYFTGKSLERKLGSGLGLDVCKKLIEMHHGKIKAESKLNEYTKFTITLPLNS